MRQKIEYVWDLNKTNIAMVLPLPGGDLKLSTNASVVCPWKEITGRHKFAKVKNNKGQVSMSVEKRRLNFANISSLKTG